MTTQVLPGVVIECGSVTFRTADPVMGFATQRRLDGFDSAGRHRQQLQLGGAFDQLGVDAGLLDAGTGRQLALR